MNKEEIEALWENSPRGAPTEKVEPSIPISKLEELMQYGIIIDEKIQYIPASRIQKLIDEAKHES